MSSIARQRPEVHTSFQGRYRFGNNEAPDQVGGRRPSESSPFAALNNEHMARGDITPTAKLVMAMLPFWARDQSSCYPAVETIARAIGVTKPTVRTGLRLLQRLGLIRIDRADANPTGRTIVLLYNRPGSRHADGTEGERLRGKDFSPGGVKNFDPKEEGSALGRVDKSRGF